MTTWLDRIVISRASRDVRMIGDQSDYRPILPCYLNEPIQGRGHGISEFAVKVSHSSKCRF